MRTGVVLDRRSVVSDDDLSVLDRWLGSYPGSRWSTDHPGLQHSNYNTWVADSTGIAVVRRLYLGYTKLQSRAGICTILCTILGMAIGWLSSRLVYGR
jgi:hypothetical protein